MNKTIIKQFLICLLSGMIAFLVLMSVAALVLLKLPVEQSSYLPVAGGVCVVCAALTSFFATRITKLKGIVAGSISALAFDLITAIILIIASSGKLGGKFFILAAVNLIVGTVSGIYAANLKRK